MLRTLQLGIIFQLAVSVFAFPIAADGFDSGDSFRSAMTAFKERNFYSARLLLQEIVLKDGRGEFGDDAQYYLALSYFYESDYKTAQFEFRALMRDFPESPFVVRANFWYGEAWFYRKEYRQALEAHSQFVRKYRENILSASALYTIGYIYNDQKRYDEAIIEFNRALHDYPDTTAAPALTLQLGIAQFNAQNYAAARRSFETLMVKYTAADNLVAARFWLGKSYYAENKYDDALREFSTVVTEHPTADQASEALYLSALCQYKKGALPQALKLLAENTTKYPKNAIYPFARLREAQLQNEQKDYQSALPPLLDIINNFQNHETFPPALQLMAEVRKKQGKTQEALAALEALRQEKNIGARSRKELLRQYADLLYEDHKYSESAGVYRDLTKEFGGDKEAAAFYLLLARSEFREGKYDSALGHLAHLEKNFDDAKLQAESLFLKAEINYALGKFPEALQMYARLVRKYKRHNKVFDAEMGIGWTYFELKQYARSADTFKKVLRKYKLPLEQAKALIALGTCQYNLRDLDGALRSYRQVVDKFAAQETEAAEARYQIAWLKFRRNAFAEADAEFTAYIAIGPHVARSAEAMYFSGLCKYQLGGFKKAEEQLATVYAREDIPDWIREKALGDLAKTRIALKDYTTARITYQQLVEKFPDAQARDEAEYQIVSLSLKLDDLTSATKTADSMAERNAKSTWYPEALREIVDYFRLRGDFKKAEEYLTKLEQTQKKPADKLELSVLRAAILAEQSKDAEALELLQTVLQNEDIREATAIKAATLLFQIYEKLQKYSEGAEWSEKLASRFAETPAVKEELQLAHANLQLLSGKKSEGRQELLGLVKSRNVGPRARFMLAEAYKADGDLTRALDFFRQVSQRDDPALWLKSRNHIGEILYARKEYEEAAREFSRIAYSETRDEVVYENALYRAALAFRQIERTREFESFRAKLKEAFPNSKYLKELE
jgi:TolA-binding protein